MLYIEQDNMKTSKNLNNDDLYEYWIEPKYLYLENAIYCQKIKVK